MPVASKGQMAVKNFSENYIDYGLIFLVTVIIYLPFLGIAPWDGNEPLRVIIARDILETGNWAVPSLHGKPYFVKPPLMNWLIAGSVSLFNTFNEWTTRFPSVLASFLTSIAIYSLTGKWFTRYGRIFAAVAMLTMVGIIEKGTSAEIDSLLIFLAAVSPLLWINGYLRHWRPVYIWSAALFILGIGFLAKGPQGPAFFYAAVFTYLLLKKRLSYFFSWAHAIGILVFLSVLGSYLAFVLQEISLGEYIRMWTEQIIQRADNRDNSFLEHLLTYPFRILLSFMPWSLLVLPAIFKKDLRRRAREIFKNEVVLFSAVLFLVNLPLYWILPNAKVRYFLPAAPFFIIILAGLFEVYIKAAKERPETEILFRKVLKTCFWVVLIAAICVLPYAVFMNLSLSTPILFLCTLVAFIAAAGILRGNSSKLERTPVSIALITGFCFMIFLNIDVEHDSKKDNYKKKIAGEINLVLPDGVTVYNVGYRRFLELSCYLENDVVQTDRFSQLKLLADNSRKDYFVFDTAMLSNASGEEKKIFEQLNWVKLYSKHYSRSRGEIVLGQL